MTFKIASDIREKWLKKYFQPCRLPARKWTLFLADILILLIPLLISLLLGIPLVAYCADDGDEAGPSERLPFDLNLTPEERRMDKHIYNRLKAKCPAGTDEGMLMHEARETSRLKRAIVDKMAELDPEHANFWRGKRYDIVTGSIMTTTQNEYSPHHLKKMFSGLESNDSGILEKMERIRTHFEKRGTLS